MQHPAGHTEDDVWRSHQISTWIPYLLCVKYNEATSKLAKR